MNDFDTCRVNFDQLAASASLSSTSRNEATTRLQLIDALFFDCLGWSKDDVVLEESYGGEYADYSFNFPRRLLIVEAKKEGSYFELPIGLDKIEYSLPGLLRSTSALKAAIEQVIGYCQKRGVPFAAVCNGRQLVAFIASRSDGVPPLDGRAVARAHVQGVCPPMEPPFERCHRKSIAVIYTAWTQSTYPPSEAIRYPQNISWNKGQKPVPNQYQGAK
jgi:hypothetical protein